LSLDPGLLEAAMSTAIQTRHTANTEEAIARHVFGSPTYFLGDEMFYGQDRLEMLARALERPFAPGRYRNPSVD
jgi:2-hydroxychromene-2-carboxylate isomerase